MSKAFVRCARPEDAPAVITGINDICKEGSGFYVTHFRPSPTWDAVLYRPETVPNHLLVIAKQEGQFIGAGRLFPGPAHSLHRHVLELGVFVLSPYRRQGVGTQLMTYMVKWAIEKGFEKITLSVFDDNVPAVRLYEKFNFVREGRQRNQIKQNGNYTDLILMALFMETFRQSTRTVL